MMHHNITSADIADRVFVTSGRDWGEKLARQGRDGSEIVPGAVDGIVERLTANSIDVLILDPLGAMHTLFENSNEDANLLMGALREIAERAKAAIILVHHTGKAAAMNMGAAGAGTSRGASAFVDAARVVRQLSAMTPTEAKTLGIGEDDRRQYIRIDKGKANLAPAAGATWVRLIGVALGNGTPKYPNGDTVQTVERWTAPTTAQRGALTDAEKAAVQDAIRQGASTERRYSSRSPEWVGYLRQPGKLFLTADSHQSIYQSTFDWDHILSILDINVEVSELLGNYRSTEQIDAAAKSYLSEPTSKFHNEGYAHEGPLPVISMADDVEAEAQLVAQFFRAASKELRLSQSSCVVLVPTQKQGRAIAEKLSELGMLTKFSLGRDLDISSEAVKVVPFQSAKGLEFPVVAVAGLWPPGYPFVPPGASSAEISELQALQRRTMFVAMTRAMRALLVVMPKDQGSALLSPFDTDLWNFQGRKE